ncbi:MAG: T9SS type A sorting domain-containing protein [Fibrobacterota bacterium]
MVHNRVLRENSSGLDALLKISGNSEFQFGTEADNTAPEAPSGLEGQAEQEKIHLSWDPATDNESGIIGYEIYRSQTPSDPVLLTKINAVTSYTDSETQENTTYYYNIKAVNGDNLKSGFSPETSVNTQSDITPPAIESAYAGDNSNQVIIKFSEQVNTNQASETSNYSISGGIIVNWVSLEENNSVRLGVSTMPEGEYTVSASGIEDLAAAPNTILSSSAASFNIEENLLPASYFTSEGDYWNNIYFNKRTNPFTLTLKAIIGLSESAGGNICLSAMPGGHVNEFPVNILIKNGQFYPRDGYTYTDDSTNYYSTGDTVAFRFEIRPADSTFDISCTPSGAQETELASGYNFTYSWTGTDEFSNIGVYSENGPLTVFDVSVNGEDLTAVTEKTAVKAKKPEIAIFPNPFNPSTVITVSGIPASLNANAPTSLKIYDSQGRAVAIPGNEQQLQKFPGGLRYTWNASGIPAGVYLAVVETNLNKSSRRRLTKKMVLIK